MRALEFEMRVERMIEPGFFPGLTVVAVVALLAKATQMHIVDLVAAGAVFVGFRQVKIQLGKILVVAAAMTLRAFQFAVLVEQRERGFGMIEGGFAPAAGVVALLTFLALAALVHVVALVTGVALLWRIAVGPGLGRAVVFVALPAGNILVLAVQREVGVRMLES